MESSDATIPLTKQQSLTSNNNNNNGEISFEQPKLQQHHNVHISRIKRQRNICILTTILLTVAFIILLIILLVKTGQNKTSSGSGKDGVVGGNGHNGTGMVCSSPLCVKSAAELLSFMNLSADPCDNFFEYACGGWKKLNDIPDAERSWGQFDVLALNNMQILKKKLSDENLNTKYTNNKALLKASTYYKSCLNQDRINSRGAVPMLNLIGKLGSWNISHNMSWDSASWDLIQSIVRIEKTAPVSLFFNTKVEADYLDSSRNIIKFEQPEQSLQREMFLENRTSYQKTREAYKKAMVNIVKLLGDEGPDVKRQLLDVFDLETKLAEASLPMSKARDLVKNYHKMTVANLTILTNNKFNWLRFLNLTFNGYAKTPIRNDTVIVVHSLEYIKKLPEIWSSVSNVTISNFLIWRVIFQYVGALSDDFKDVKQDFREVRDGTKERKPVWLKCLDGKNSPYRMIYGLLYVEEKFTKSKKDAVMQMIREIRQIFVQNLQSMPWMDKATRIEAEGKVSKMLQNIGYPDYLKNATALNAKYEKLKPGPDYFDNLVEKATFMKQNNYADIGKPVNNIEWLMNPQVVNAYYSFHKNKIVFPAGILQPPFYDKDRPNAMNYGGIGAVVGHEITHGFDDNGRQFDADGNLRKWWSDNAIAGFTNQTKCLISQYSQYKFFGVNIKGAQTLGENIADNGGVKQAYQAYQKYVAKKEKEHILPGVNATNEQLFFLGFAQVWCGKTRRQAALEQITTGVHTPGEYRVIGTLSNSEAFAKAYKCPVGSKMNPKKKCQVW